PAATIRPLTGSAPAATRRQTAGRVRCRRPGRHPPRARLRGRVPPQAADLRRPRRLEGRGPDQGGDRAGHPAHRVRRTGRGTGVASVVPAAGPPTWEDVNTGRDPARTPARQTGGNVRPRRATVLTVANGTSPPADILARGGKTAAVGPNWAADPGMAVIEAA